MDQRPDIRRLALAVLMPGFNGTTAPGWLLDAVRDGLGSALLFGHNTPDLQTTRLLNESLHAAGRVLITIDEESGDVSRLQATTGSSLPGNAALGAADDADLTRQAGQALGGLLAAVDVDVDLAPSLDVASEPRNPVIGVRSFGPDPAQVARHAIAFIAGLQAGGVGTSAKHFPGHGSTTVDSHVALPVLDVSAEILEQRDVSPFRAAAENGVDSIMTGHLQVPVLGDSPGTLEPAVGALARSFAGGGERVIVTDALDMGAVTDASLSTLGAVCVRALQAGADLLCLGNTVGRDDEAMFTAALDGIIGAVVSGELEVRTLRASAARIEALRQRAAGYRAGAQRLSPEAALDHLTTLGLAAARRAVSVAAGDVRRQAPVTFIDLRRRISLAAGRVAPGYANALAGRGVDAHVLTPGVPGAQALVTELKRLDPRRSVVVLTREPLADEAERVDLDAVLAARSDAVVIHGGTATSAPEVPHLVLSHGVGAANATAALDLILGEA